MKNKSAKTQITLLLTLLMATLSILLLTFMLFISKSVATQTAKRQLTDVLRNNVAYVEVHEKKPTVSDGFFYHHNGVTTLIYSQNESLIAGQIPVSFQNTVPFENGTIRMVSSDDTNYLVLDLFLSENWEQGVWLRGLVEAPNTEALSMNMLIIALIALPLFILMAAAGSYHITRRVFRPLEHITATAEAINEAKDLSGRIGLPAGEDEFSRLAADFDQMFERLERSFEAEKQFTADASHELRTPVSIIKGACEYAEKYDETPEDHAETISMIHRQADKMAALISQLLSMTRLEQGTESVKMECMDLGKFTENFCKEQHWDSSKIIVSISNATPVAMNPELIGRLITNLVENAWKHSDSETPVRLHVTADHTEAFLMVQDHGCGIPADEQEKIWQRFYQADASRSNHEGSGLGLSMVKQIAELHGGHMTLESIPGKGSTFTLRLPLLKKV